MKSYLFALLAFSLLSACANYQHPSAVKPETNNDYIFNAVGYAPIEVQSGDSADVKMLNAIKVSKIEAYKELAEQIYGVLLTADNNVDGASLKDDNIKSQVKGLVKGARVLKSYHEGGLYITELELDMKTLPYLKNRSLTTNKPAVRKLQPAVYY